MAPASPRVRRLAIQVLCAVVALFMIIEVARILSSVERIFGTHAGIAMTQDQVDLAYKKALQSGSRRPRPVPRIIHQIFHNWHDPGNETIPQDWQELRQTCLSLHPTWEHKLWTESASRDFIEKEYPWFLDTYDDFRFPVQKIDALRYFLMRHFGGIYIDLDNGCRKSLEPLLYYPIWVTDGGHGTLSNNILGAEPEHPFWKLMTDSILPRAHEYILPYITISYATGQWYETEIWQIYHDIKPKEAPDLLRVMMDSRPTGAPWTFFTAGRGGTWDNWDNQFLGWVGNNLFTALFYLIVGAGAIGGILYMVRQALRRRHGLIRGLEC